MIVGFLIEIGFHTKLWTLMIRLTEPMIRGSDGKLRVTSWEDAVNKAKELISGSKKFNGLISSNSSLEEMALFGSMLTWAWR